MVVISEPVNTWNIENEEMISLEIREELMSAENHVVRLINDLHKDEKTKDVKIHTSIRRKLGDGNEYTTRIEVVTKMDEKKCE